MLSTWRSTHGPMLAGLRGRGFDAQLGADGDPTDVDSSGLLACREAFQVALRRRFEAVSGSRCHGGVHRGLEWRPGAEAYMYTAHR